MNTLRLLPFAVIFAVIPAFAQFGEYSGPSVLSRGGGGGMAPVGGIGIRPYINISALYNSRLLSVAPGPDGNLAAAEGAFGGEAAVGLYGYKGWKRTTLGINYRGDYRKYERSSPYDSSNQFLVFGLTHQPSKHISITLREGAGTYTRNFSYLGTFGFYDPTFAQVPQDELLDTRTTYMTTMADVTYLKSARLSFNFGGTGFVVRRQKSSLYGVVGGTARGDATYRLSRRTTGAVDYFYTHFGYNKAFGTGDMHSVGANYSVDLSRRWQLRFRVGVMHMETLALGTVTIDPEVAAILGRTQGIAAFYGVYTQPAYSAQINRQFRHGSASVGYNHGATPGNGIYLTSRQNAATASYTYTGMRRWSLSSNFSYSDMQSIGQDIGDYRSVGGGFGATRSITRRNLYLTARWDVRHTIAGREFLRNYYTATVGFAYSPGDVPLRLW